MLMMKEFILRIQIHDNRNDCKSDGHQDRIDPPEGFNEAIVFAMVPPQCLECTGKSMCEVKEQGDHTNDIHDDNPELLVSHAYSSVQVCDGMLHSGISDLSQLVGELHLEPKIAHVNTQENKDQDTQQGHVT